MAGSALPPGWSYNPSGWLARLPVLALALIGFGIATYLELYQLGVVQIVWEPFFANGSHRILRESTFARMLPIPDALLGAGAYLLDAVFGAVGGHTRWRTMPWVVSLLGVIAGELALGGVLLALSQPLTLLAPSVSRPLVAQSSCSVRDGGSPGHFLVSQA